MFKMIKNEIWQICLSTSGTCISMQGDHLPIFDIILNLFVDFTVISGGYENAVSLVYYFWYTPDGS